MSPVKMPKRKRQSSVKRSPNNKSPRKTNLNASTTEENDISTLDKDDTKLKDLVSNVVFTFDAEDNEAHFELDTCDELACLSAGEESESENKEPLEADGTSHNLLAASSCSSPLKRASPLSPTLFDNVLQHKQTSVSHTVQIDPLSNATPNQVPKMDDEQGSTITRGRRSKRKRIIRGSPEGNIVVDVDATTTLPLSNNDRLEFKKQEPTKEITTSQEPLECSDKINLPEANFQIIDDYKLEEISPPGPNYRLHVEKSKEELCRDVIYELDEVDICWLDVFNQKVSEDYFNLLRNVEYEEMGLLLDRFEKECYYALQNAGMGQPGESDEDAVCCICLDGTSDDSNLILFCDMCNIAVHQECFGVPFVPEGTWLCRRCSIIPHGVVECIFCPNKDGAFKQTVDGRWSHVLCALWIPEVRFSNPSILEPVDDIDDIPTARWKLICFLCKLKGVGACIQCHLRSCVTAFHATCAQKAGLSLQLAECGRVKMKAACDKHTSDREKEILKQKVETVNKILAEKRASEPQSRYPSIPVDRLNAISELISFPLKKKFILCLLAYWKLKRMSRGGAALLRNLESIWIEGLKEPLAPFPLKAPDDNPLVISKLQPNHKKLLTKFQAGVTVLKDYCALVVKHSKTQYEDIKSRHRYMELFYLHGLDVYHDILTKLAAKDRYDTFAEPVTDDDAPNYSTVIKNPMDLSTMKEKTEQLKYTAIDDLEADFNLMINNCMTYNKKSTQFYKEAVKLKEYGNQVFQDARVVLEQRTLDENAVVEEVPDASVSGTCDNGDQLAEPADSKKMAYHSLPGEVLIKNVLEELICCDKSGFFAQPVDVNVVPDYLSIIEKPMDFSTMRNKLNESQYSCIEDLEKDFSLMIKNCLQYNEENSAFYKRGEELNATGMKILETAIQKQYMTVIPAVIKTENNNYKTDPDSSEELESDGPMLVKITETELIEDVLKKLISTDKEEIFAEPVSDEDAPEYSTMIKIPMDFSLMQEKLKMSVYSTLEDLEKDFSLMIDNCKKYNSSGTMHFNYATKVKRAGNSIFSAARKRILSGQKKETNVIP